VTTANESLETEIQRAADLIEGADCLVVAAGAGIGVDSGMPDFRGPDGFWKAYPALAKAQLAFTDVASTRTFESDPALAWGFYGHRLDLYRKTEPHAGFQILNNWMRAKAIQGRVFMSNVDGQFQKAGFDQEAIHECHGSLHHLQCINGCIQDTWSAAEFNPEFDTDSCQLTNATPACLYCGELARPNVLMFGDWSWVNTRTLQQKRRERNWLDQLKDSFPYLTVIEVGAGTAIPSVRQFSHHLIKEHGARLVRINIREHHVPRPVDVGIALGALTALSRIDGLSFRAFSSFPCAHLQKHMGPISPSLFLRSCARLMMSNASGVWRFRSS
jgi:NAD-dependent SIR2 family protein deacetylase